MHAGKTIIHIILKGGLLRVSRHTLLFPTLARWMPDAGGSEVQGYPYERAWGKLGMQFSNLSLIYHAREPWV